MKGNDGIRTRCLEGHAEDAVLPSIGRISLGKHASLVLLYREPFALFYVH